MDGSRILSAYKTLKGERLWIITEAADDEGKTRRHYLPYPAIVLSWLSAEKRVRP